MNLGMRLYGRGVVWVFLTLAVMAGSVYGEAADSSEPSKGQALLDAAAKYWGQLKSLQADITTEWTSSLEGVTHKHAERIRFTMARPGRLSVRALNSLVDTEIAVDDSQGWVYQRFLGEYWQGPVQGSLTDQGVSGGLLGESLASPLLQVLIHGRLEKLLGGYSGAIHVSEAAGESGTVHHLRLTSRSQEEPDAEVWLVMGESVQVDRIRYDLSKLLAQWRASRRGGDVPDLSIEIKLTNWQMDAAVNDAAFTLSPPEHARRVIYFGMGEAPKHPLLGKEAPDFKLYLLDGSEKALSSHWGKDIVVLDFWSIRCPPCRVGLPILTELTNGYRDKGVVFYAVNVEDDKNRIEGFLEEMGISPLTARDNQQQLGGRYFVSGIPQSVVIDRAGKVQSVHVGFDERTGGQLKAELDALLAGVDIVGMSSKEGLPVKLVCQEVRLEKQHGTAQGCYSLAAELANQGTTVIPAYSYLVVIQAENQQQVAVAGTLAIEPGSRVTLTIPCEDWCLRLESGKKTTVRAMVWASGSLENQAQAGFKEVELKEE